ncbi:hypothetical protein F5Y16DRAFT_400801 [Xylariaceae sp. FL0255]|nr:hypothetical protein F5Y16DRAFT_400801 [Xylariaceae sp. FL0255]
MPQCGDTGWPYIINGMCCPEGIEGLPLAGDTTVLCCTDNSGCGTVNTISCDISLLNPNSTNGSDPPLIQTIFTDGSLPTCAKGCCPWGYHCADGNCNLNLDQSHQPNGDPLLTTYTAPSPSSTTKVSSSTSSTSSAQTSSEEITSSTSSSNPTSQATTSSPTETSASSSQEIIISTVTVVPVGNSSGSSSTTILVTATGKPDNNSTIGNLSPNSSLSVPAIAGVAVGGLAVIVFLGVSMAYYTVFRKSAKKKKEAEDMQNNRRDSASGLNDFGQGAGSVPSRITTAETENYKMAELPSNERFYELG